MLHWNCCYIHNVLLTLAIQLSVFMSEYVFRTILMGSVGLVTQKNVIYYSLLFSNVMLLQGMSRSNLSDWYQGWWKHFWADWNQLYWSIYILIWPFLLHWLVFLLLKLSCTAAQVQLLSTLSCLSLLLFTELPCVYKSRGWAQPAAKHHKHTP